MEKFFFLPPINNYNDSAFSVNLAGITYPDPTYKIYRKCSNVYVVEYIVKGEGTVLCDGKEYRIKKNDVYILPRGSEHLYYSDKSNPWCKKWFNVTGKLCEKLLNAYTINGCVHFENVFIEDLFDEFFDFCDKNTDVRKINEFGAVIFHKIIQQLVSNKERSIQTDASKIKDYIDRNIYEKLSASEIALKFGFSVSQLGRIFKSEYKTTVYSYILEQKLKTAENLLKNSALSVKEISNMLKFTDEHYFSNIFKKKCGVTPSEVRK